MLPTNMPSTDPTFTIVINEPSSTQETHPTSNPILSTYAYYTTDILEFPSNLPTLMPTTHPSIIISPDQPSLSSTTSTSSNPTSYPLESIQTTGNDTFVFCIKKMCFLIYRILYNIKTNTTTSNTY